MSEKNSEQILVRKEKRNKHSIDRTGKRIMMNGNK
jgi:hypothetical protein